MFKKIALKHAIETNNTLPILMEVEIVEPNHAQLMLLGGIAGGLMLKFVLGGLFTDLGVTVLSSGVSPMQGFVLETLLTFILGNTVLNTAISGKGGSLNNFASRNKNWERWHIIRFQKTFGKPGQFIPRSLKFNKTQRNEELRNIDIFNNAMQETQDPTELTEELSRFIGTLNADISTLSSRIARIESTTKEQEGLRAQGYDPVEEVEYYKYFRQELIGLTKGLLEEATEKQTLPVLGDIKEKRDKPSLQRKEVTYKNDPADTSVKKIFRTASTKKSSTDVLRRINDEIGFLNTVKDVIKNEKKDPKFAQERYDAETHRNHLREKGNETTIEEHKHLLEIERTALLNNQNKESSDLIFLLDKEAEEGTLSPLEYRLELAEKRLQLAKYESGSFETGKIEHFDQALRHIRRDIDKLQENKPKSKDKADYPEYSREKKRFHDQAYQLLKNIDAFYEKENVEPYVNTARYENLSIY